MGGGIRRGGVSVGAGFLRLLGVQFGIGVVVLCCVFKSGSVAQLTLNDAKEEISVHPLLRIGGRC